MPQVLRFQHALLPDGVADQVVVRIENGAIAAVQPGDEAGPDLIRGLALPGLPNLHGHAFQRGMAGLAERRGPADDSFWTWREVMYRFLARLSPEDVEAIAAFAYVEMLERGFTAVGEFHYLHHDVDGQAYTDAGELAGRVVAAAREAGIGLTLLPAYYAQGGFGGAPPSDGQRRFLHDRDSFSRLMERARAHAEALPGARVGVAPHSLRAVGTDDLAWVAALAPDGPIHIHAAEQVREVEDCLAATGRRPVELLLDAGLDERWCVIHATHMVADETDRLAGSGAIAGLCPVTESSLGDGVFDGPGYLRAGGRFGIGTDSNIDIDAAGELRQLEYSQRLARRGRNLMTTRDGESTGLRLFAEAASGGARALRQPMGAIATGRRADVVVLDLDHPALAATPRASWIDSWIFSAGRDAISTVIAGGVTVVEDGRHTRRERILRRYRETMRRVMADL